jgi:hypothetical protein
LFSDKSVPPLGANRANEFLHGNRYQTQSNTHSYYRPEHLQTLFDPVPDQIVSYMLRRNK